MNTSTFGNVPVVSIALVLGFLSLHCAEQLFGSHEPAHSDYGHDHEHSLNIAGTLGAAAMAGQPTADQSRGAEPTGGGQRDCGD
jgi:ZIP family zinc transporter